MGKTVSHHISLCTKCQRTGGVCEAGYDLAQTVVEAINRAGPLLDDDFEISGYCDLAGCPETCRVGWRATLDTVYLFGDVSESQDLNDLVLLAQSIVSHQSDQKADTQEHAAKLSMPVPVPAAMMIVEFVNRVRAAA